MPLFVVSLITTLLQLVWPQAPVWLGQMLALAIPKAVEVVEHLAERSDLTGAEKAIAATTEIGAFIDASLDGVPEWSSLSEARRDRIITGLVELALFAQEVAGRAGGKADARKAIRKLRALDVATE